MSVATETGITTVADDLDEPALAPTPPQPKRSWSNIVGPLAQLIGRTLSPVHSLVIADRRVGKQDWDKKDEDPQGGVEHGKQG